MAISLLSPLRIGSIDLPNRIVVAPTTRSRATAAGVPQPIVAEYYAARASAGLIITEATQVSYEGWGYPRTPGIQTQEQIEGWRHVTSSVHVHGGRIFMQLLHAGRIASRLNRPFDADVVAPSAIRAPGQMYTDAKGLVDHDEPRALGTLEIERVVRDYVQSAKAAIEAGCDGVEIHSANGYLMHQFLSSNVNMRSDRYGGSIENRVRLPLEIVHAVTSAVGADKVGVRVSPGHTFNDIEEHDIEELYGYYLSALDRINLAYLHVMRPLHEFSKDPVTMARAIFKGRLIAAGNYTPEGAEQLVSSGGADAVAFGKAFIANPDLVKRIISGSKLNEPDEATFYTPGPEGYLDYPVMAS
jgi:N-ethylmaleimide reductase